MTELIKNLILGSGLLLIIYRLYLALTDQHQASVESKNDLKVKQDVERTEEDAKRVKESDAAFNNAVADFERDNKG